MLIPKTVISKLKKSKIIQSMIQLPTTAKTEGWTMTYDRLADDLYFSPKIIPNNAVLFNISKEMAIYITAQSKIKGIFIENFSSNYVQHNKDFKDLLKLFDKKTEENIYEIQDENKEDLYQKALSSTLLDTFNNKEQLLSSARRFAT